MRKTRSGVIRTKNVGLIYWSHVESKEAVTSDGKMIGLVRGILVDPKTWTIPSLVVAVNEDIVDELNMERPLKSPLVTIPTKYVEDISYMVQLNTDLASMRGAISEYRIEQS